MKILNKRFSVNDFKREKPREVDMLKNKKSRSMINLNTGGKILPKTKTLNYELRPRNISNDDDQSVKTPTFRRTITAKSNKMSELSNADTNTVASYNLREKKKKRVSFKKDFVNIISVESYKRYYDAILVKPKTDDTSCRCMIF